MHFGRINLITPPDQLFNNNLSYLLVYPSNEIKTQFQQIVSKINEVEDVNVFVMEEETNIEWLLNVVRNVDIAIIDVDRCDAKTKLFVSFLLANPNTYYITNDDTPWGLISRNRIVDLSWILAQFDNAESDDDD